MNKMHFKHESVLLEECINALNIKPDGLYIDGTAGGGGHSLKIAEKLTTGRLIALDRDPSAIRAAKERLSAHKDKVTLVQSNYSEIPRQIHLLGITGADGILLDLGVSSHQLDEGGRGFSYNKDAALDMRMEQQGLSAYDVINSYQEGELVKIFRAYGEEKFASRIARGIVKRREEKAIETTFELAEIIKENIPAATRREGGHPAKRVFQAIRIEVNAELLHLKMCIEESFAVLNKGGRFAIITFHSLEDRIVKRLFAEFCTGCTCPSDFPICVCGKKPKAKAITKKPVLPSQIELENNKRSHSAKLRIIEKL